jgi:hypothetical protein
MSHPYPMFGSQDLNDDDAAVIDSYLVETDAPPDMKPAEQSIPANAGTPIAVTTKFIAREQILTPTMDPVQLLPADANRKNLYIRIYSPTSQAGDAVRIGQTASEAIMGARLLQGDAPVIGEHTGAVYAYPQSVTGTTNSANVGVEFWAVTV